VPSPVPTPVAAAIGIVPAVVAHARRLPGKAVQLPVIAVSSVLTAIDTVRQEYEDLADRGERVIARLRGTSLDDLEDTVEDAVAATPFAGAYDAVEDALEVARTKAGEVGREAAGRAGRVGEQAAQTAERVADAQAQTVERPGERLADAQASKGAATPKATEPDTTRVDSAATAEVVGMADAVSAFSGAPDVGSHSELPLADYDHMTLGSLRGRLRSLNVAQLVQLRDYEKAHADRLPVVTMLDNRIAKLATDAAATPSPGGSDAATSPAGSSRGKVAAPSGARTGGSPHTKVRTT
jgi:hypothetical protein